MSKVCKFYLQGNCHYGSSCRFLHSDNNNRSHRSSSHYYENYRPKNNRNVKHQYYDEYEDYENTEYDDHYEQNNHYSGRTNKYYGDGDYNDKQNYDYQTKNEYSVKNYYKEHEKEVDSRVDYNYNSNRKDHKKSNEFNRHQSQNVNNQEEYYTQIDKFKSDSNRYNNSADQFNPNHTFEQSVHNQKEKLLKLYEREITMYRSHVKELLNSNIWPFTCFHPVGHAYPIQPTGSLNFLDISFEEIRCDYYITKTICPDPGPIHKQSVDSLLSIARKQKEDIISFVDSVQDDMLEVFEKCEESKTNSNFQNSIETDPNSYWDMCYNNLDVFQANQALTKSYSFIDVKKEKKKTKNEPSLKIFMQTEVYGNINCQAYKDEEFTEYIPILPPPKKCCF